MPELAALLERLETTVTVAYLGYQLDKAGPKPWPHFAWRVTVMRNGEGYSTDYRTGVAHAKPMPVRFRDDLPEHARLEAWRNDKRAPVWPSVADVVASLASDARSATDTFESFCSEMGYDTDSRRALDTYLACQGALNACRRLFREHFDAVVGSAAEY